MHGIGERVWRAVEGGIGLSLGLCYCLSQPRQLWGVGQLGLRRQ